MARNKDTETFKAPRRLGKDDSNNPKWLLPVALTLLVAGPVWIVISYVTGAEYPVPIGNWNLGVGFALMIGGLGFLTRWK